MSWNDCWSFSILISVSVLSSFLLFLPSSKVMNLETECSALESVEDNESVTPKDLSTSCGTDVDNNVFYHRVEQDDKLLVQRKSGGDEPSESAEGSIKLSNSAAAKGYGLKKWRRIRRDFNQEGGSSADSGKALKRGLLNTKNSAPNLRKPIVKKVAAKDSVVSPNKLEVGPSSASGSIEDCGSNSSNTVVENAWHENKMRSQKGKGKLEMSKKSKGEQVRIEKENSHSSMESDFRSFNFVSVQATNSGTSNGRPSINYDGEKLFREERGSSFREEDVGADLSWDIKEEEKSEDIHGSSTDKDSLLHSVTMLESAQEALQKEIKKLTEIGSEGSSGLDDSELGFGDPTYEPSSSDVLQVGENSGRLLESDMIVLKQNVSILESKVEEGEVIEVEATLKNKGSRSRKSTQGGEIESEVEWMLKQRIEAEVEYEVISSTIQKLRDEAVGEMKVLESKATILNKQAQKLEMMSCLDTEEEEEEVVGKLEKRVCKLTVCLCIQFIMLLVVVVCMFVFKVSLPYEELVVTPT